MRRTAEELTTEELIAGLDVAPPNEKIMAANLRAFRAVAQEALRRAGEYEEIHNPGMAAAIMKSALRTIAGERLKSGGASA